MTECAFKPTLEVHNRNQSEKYQLNYAHFEALEFLLWSWKGTLSREWYPYLFGLKHDLQLNQSELTYEKVIKTQTLPLAHRISKS